MPRRNADRRVMSLQAVRLGETFDERTHLVIAAVPWIHVEVELVCCNVHVNRVVVNVFCREVVPRHPLKSRSGPLANVYSPSATMEHV